MRQKHVFIGQWRAVREEARQMGINPRDIIWLSHAGTGRGWRPEEICCYNSVHGVTDEMYDEAVAFLRFMGAWGKELRAHVSEGH